MQTIGLLKVTDPRGIKEATVSKITEAAIVKVTGVTFIPDIASTMFHFLDCK